LKVKITKIYELIRSVVKIKSMSVFLQILIFLIHPFYVSVTKVTYNDATHRLEVSCKIFTDDLEKALKQGLEQKPDLKNNERLEQNDLLIQNYLASRLKITLQKVDVGLEYLGFEHEEEATIIYFESTQAFKRPQEVAIYNEILTEVIPDQLNFVHYFQGDFHKSYQLSRKEKTIKWMLP